MVKGGSLTRWGRSSLALTLAKKLAAVAFFFRGQKTFEKSFNVKRAQCFFSRAYVELEEIFVFHIRGH